MFHASNLEYERAGILLLACPIVCAFDRACVHAFALQTVNINNGLSHEV